MKKKAKPPILKRPKPYPLKSSTCAQLLAWIESPVAENEHKKDVALRGRYQSNQNRRLLGLCGPLKASYHIAWTRTARQLEKVPHIVLKACGGKPKQSSMPRFSASLKRLGSLNGVVIHRFGKGAFILAHPLKPGTIEAAEALCPGDVIDKVEFPFS